MNQYVLENPVSGVVLEMAKHLGTNVQELLDSYFQSSFELRSEIVAAQSRTDGTILISARTASIAEVEASIRTIADRYGFALSIPGGAFIASFVEVSADAAVSGLEDVGKAGKVIGDAVSNVGQAAINLTDWRAMIALAFIYWLATRK